MKASDFLRAQGKAFGTHLRQLGVPVSIVDGWQTAWAFLTVDCDEEGADAVSLGTTHIQLLTAAQDLSRIYGR